MKESPEILERVNNLLIELPNKHGEKISYESKSQVFIESSAWYDSFRFMKGGK